MPRPSSFVFYCKHSSFSHQTSILFALFRIRNKTHTCIQNERCRETKSASTDSNQMDFMIASWQTSRPRIKRGLFLFLLSHFTLSWQTCLKKWCQYANWPSKISSTGWKNAMRTKPGILFGAALNHRARAKKALPVSRLRTYKRAQMAVSERKEVPLEIG